MATPESADAKFQQMLTNLRTHDQRFFEFHVPAAAPSFQNAVVDPAGHFHFGLQDLDYEDIQEVFNRDGCAQEIEEVANPEKVEKGALHLANYLIQNDLLAGAEKAMLDMSRTRIKQASMSAMIRKGHAHAKGLITGKFLNRATRVSSKG